MTAAATGSVLISDVRPYGEGDPVDVLVVDGTITEIGAGLTAPDAVSYTHLTLPTIYSV